LYIIFLPFGLINSKPYTVSYQYGYYMNKENYKTPLEQEIFEIISNSELISFEEIKDLFPEIKINSLKKATASLSSKGYLYRLKRGLYIVTPMKKLIIRDPFAIATQIYPSYIAFSSALRFYNLIEYEPFTIFLVTSVKSRQLEVGEYTFRYISLGDKAIGATNINGKWISVLEKTFFDCFYKPQYSGGFEVVTKALYETTHLKWDAFLKFVRKLGSSSLCQRIGYILELLKLETGYKVPKYLFSYLNSKTYTPARLLSSGPSHGIYSKKWKILDNVGRERILGWWYNGR